VPDARPTGQLTVRPVRPLNRSVTSTPASGTTTPRKAAVGTPSKPSGSASKVLRKWNDSYVTEADMAALDFSAPPPAASAEGGDINVDELVSTAAMGKRSKDGIYEVADYHTKSTSAEDDGEMDDLISRALSKTALSSKAATGASDLAAAAPATGAFSSLFSRLTGGKTLEQADLRPVMDAMEKHLMAKNVAREVCEKVCEGVESRLLGKKLGALSSESARGVSACPCLPSDPSCALLRPT
jgi:signal recognition particle receptor subunit alpha